MDICTVCSTKTPRFRRTRSPWRHSSAMRPRGWSAWRAGSGGTTQSTTAMPASARAQVRPKMPGSPPQAASRGLSTRASANMRPMLPPTMAMALVRTLSRVRSASSAVTAAETAPAPCRPRPHQAQQRVGRGRQQAARRKDQQPGDDDALAPEAVRSQAQGQLEHGLGEPVQAHGQADHGRIIPARVFARLQREHRQHQEQAQHAQRKDQRQAGAGTAFLRGHAARCGRGGAGAWAPWTGVGNRARGALLWGKQSAILAHRPALRVAGLCKAVQDSFVKGRRRRPSRPADRAAMRWHGF